MCLHIFMNFSIIILISHVNYILIVLNAFVIHLNVELIFSWTSALVVTNNFSSLIDKLPVLPTNYVWTDFFLSLKRSLESNTSSTEQTEAQKPSLRRATGKNWAECYNSLGGPVLFGVFVHVPPVEQCSMCFLFLLFFCLHVLLLTPTHMIMG